MKKFLLVALMVGSFAVATPASAATLTTQQVSAIIGLLRAFGVEQPTIDIVYAQLSPRPAAPAPVKTPTPGTAIIPVPNPLPASPMENTPQTNSPAPFVRTGSASAALIGKTNTLPLTPGSRSVLATLEFTNNTNETLLFSGIGDENRFFSVRASTGWAPRIQGSFRNDSFANDTAGIKPGAKGLVQIFVVNAPSTPNSVDIGIVGFELVGQTTGELVPVAGFPIDLGTVEAK